MSDATEDTCERCGKHAPGGRRWMFYPWWRALFFEQPVAHEFYCFHCLRIMRIFAIIGFTLLAIIIAAIIAVTIWVSNMP